MRRKILKKKYKNLCRLVLGGIAFFSSMFINQHNLKALPIPDTENALKSLNNVSMDTSGNISLTGTNQNGFMAWRDFSVANDETLKFNSMKNMLNYVTAVNPSLIYGEIDASAVSNNFYIINPSGILFGPNSVVKANNFYVSTRSLTESQISAYINGGDNYDIFTQAGKANINDGGLKSSDILGTYDIADGDVMFLGKVQADKLTVEGNVIQIRNTANMKDKNGSQLSGDKVTLISDKSPEVGYVVDATNVDYKLENPFTFDETLSEDDKIIAIADYYGIYLYLTDEANNTVINRTDPGSDNEWYNNHVTSEKNYAALKQLVNFFSTVTDDINGDNVTDDTDMTLIGLALDKTIRNNISKGAETIREYSSDSGVVSGMQTREVDTFTFNETDFNTNSTSTYSTELKSVKQSYDNVTAIKNYKYFVADRVESAGEYMPNSANALNWKAKNLNGGTQTISDFRLIQDAYDLNIANYSRWDITTQLDPASTAGTIHGNYMLDNDIDMSVLGKFKPLGYSMTLKDFTSKSSLLDFNGLNFKIKNLTTDNDASQYSGLFSIFNGTAKNLRLQNVNVGAEYSTAAGAFAGAIAHFGGMYYDWEQRYIGESYPALETTIKNIAVLEAESGQTNSVKADDYSGGLVGITGGTGGNVPIGYLAYHEYKDTDGWWKKKDETVIDFDEWQTYYNNGYNVDSAYPVYAVPGESIVTFDNVENFASVGYSGGTSVGGVVGYKDAGTLSITNAINNGSIAAYNRAGGIVGYISEGSETWNDETGIYEYSGKLNLNRVFNKGSINATSYAGGLVGVVGDSNEASIEKSWNEGNVTSENGTAGGIAADFKNASDSGKVDQVFNSGEIQGKTYTGGLFGTYISSGKLTNSYNTGKVTGGDDYVENTYWWGTSIDSDYTGGIFGQFNSGTVENVYNSGEIVVNNSFAGGLFGNADEYTYGTIENSYNVGKVNGTRSGGIGGYLQDNEDETTLHLNKVYNGGEVGTSGNYDKLFAKRGDTETADLTDIKGEENINVSEIYSQWGNIDTDGTTKNATWRVYFDPDKPTDTTRQPLLTSFMQSAKVKRYSELNSPGDEIDPYKLVTPTLNMHAVHDVWGNVLDVRYKNSGKTATVTEDGKEYYYLLDTNLVNFDVVESSEKGKFAVTTDKYFAKALVKSSQFGYNFSFDADTNNDWKNTTGGTDSTLDSKIVSAGTKAADNAIYLKVGNGTVPNEPEIKKEITDPPGNPPTEETQTTTINISITVGNGVFNKDSNNVTYDIGGNHYTVSDPSGASDGKFTYTYKEVAVYKKDDNGNDTSEIDHFDTIIETITYKDSNGTETTYSIDDTGDKKLTYDPTTGKYTVAVVDGTTTYNITINPGKITSTDTMNVTINVGDGKIENGTFLPVNGEDDYSSTNNAIDDLIKDVFAVSDNGDGTTTLKLKTSVTPTTGDDGEKIYKVTKDDTEYIFSTTDGVHFTFKTGDDNNKVTYNITLNPGTVTTYLEEEVTIQANNGTVNNGVFTVIKTSDTDKGYTVTSDNEDSSISNLLGNLTVTRTSDGNETTVNLDIISGLKTDANGNYTYTSTVGKTVTTYTIKVVNGDITKYATETVAVTANNGSLNDGTWSGADYSINGGGDIISTLLQNLTVTYDTTTKKTYIDTSSLPSGLVHVSGDTYTYTVTKDGTTTVYTITINPGNLSIYNTPSSSSTGGGNDDTSTPASDPTPTPSTPASDPTPTPSTPSTPSTPAETPSTPEVVEPTPTEPTTPTVVEPVTPSPTITNLAVTVKVGDGTLTDGVFANTGFTIGDQTIRDLFSGATVTYDGDRTILTNLPSGLTQIGNNQFTYTVTDPDGNQTIYTITIDPGLLSIFNTPAQTPEPEIETVTPEVQPVTTTIDEPDVELRSSNREEFGGEKGDYVDLDLQDHTLIEITDTNVAVEELNVTPEEFSEDAARNVVNNDNMELTSITDVAPADISTDITDGANIPADFNAADGANIGGDFQAGGEIDGGLSSLDSTSSNSSVGGNNGRGSRNENSFSGGRSASNRNSNGLSNTSNSSSNSNSRGNSSSNRNSNGSRSANSTSNSDSESGSSDSSSSSSESQNNGELGAVESGQTDSQQETSTSENESSQGKNSDDKKSSSEKDSENQNSDDEDKDDENEEDEESSSEK